jgi:hypothetical protein
MIAGIALILNPTTPHASDMKEILRLFMEQHPHNPKADDFTQQEATIVSFPLWKLCCRILTSIDRHFASPRFGA